MGEIRMKVKRLRRVAGSWYWRPSKSLEVKGYHSIPLGRDPVRAIEHARILNARVDRERKRTSGPRFAPGTVGDIIRVYTDDYRFTKLAENTKRTYMPVLIEIERESGDFPITAIERPALRAAYRQISKRGKAIARLHIVLWINLMEVARDEGWRRDNPAREMGLPQGPARTRKWSTEEFERFRATAIAAGRPSLALAIDLAFDIGQRPGDTLRLTWGQWNGNGFSLSQSKTKARVAVPILSAALREQLTGMERRGVQVIINEVTGRAYRISEFQNAFRKVRAAAGIAGDLQARDTRRTALTEAGDGGATDDQIRSLSGHRSRQAVSSYVHPTTTMASGAQAARERARNRSGKIATKDE